MRNAIIMLITAFILLSFFTIILPVETCVASGNTLHVGSGQPYSNIQDAINASEDGDTVYVYSGTYNENILLNRSINLIGEDKDSTIIKGKADNENTVKISKWEFSEYISNANISGFKILQNPTAKSNGFAGIFLEYADNCKITDCIIKDSYYGIWAKQTDESTISGSTIENNEGTGILLMTFSDNNKIKNNVIQNNKIGIDVKTGTTGNTISENTISGHSEYGLRMQSGCNNNIIHHNTFDNKPECINNAKDVASNTYDDGSEGNYWDDYMGYDNNSNGIGDTPYDIPGGDNQDLYPLGYFQGGSENQAPTADAGGPYSGQINSEITFDGSGSSDSDGNIVGYRWDWTNDGTYDTNWLTTSTTTHSYTAAGTYTVKLQVKDDDGATDTDIAQVTITAENQKPTAEIISITPSTATEGESIYFHGIGQDSDGVVTEYSWSSNIDEFLSSSSTFTKSDLSVGTHTIYFKVKDNNGEWSEENSKDITINPSPNKPPVANAGGPYTGYINVSISFDASDSYDPDEDEIVSYVWDFGDGTNGTGITIEHTYNFTGNYTVTLTVTDSQGKTATISTYANVSIQPQPTDQNGNDRENGGTPGFELLLTVMAITLVLFWKRHGYIKK
jgi:parallel beta-helix repeat protein